jgi:hypothetical protein
MIGECFEEVGGERWDVWRLYGGSTVTKPYATSFDDIDERLTFGAEGL